MRAAKRNAASFTKTFRLRIGLAMMVTGSTVSALSGLTQRALKPFNRFYVIGRDCRFTFAESRTRTALFTVVSAHFDTCRLVATYFNMAVYSARYEVTPTRDSMIVAPVEISRKPYCVQPTMFDITIALQRA
jgi:hypothetical protein